MMEDSNFGFSQDCPFCKGTGRVNVEVGIINIKIEERDCPKCEGKKKMFVWYTCPLFSSSERDMGAGNTMSGTVMNYVNCIGISCLYWDRDHNGGCMKRKLLVKQLYE